MKNEIRKAYKRKRSQMSIDDVTSKSESAAKMFLGSSIYRNCDTIMLYMPLGKETDTRLIAESAFSLGKKVVFPVTDADSGEITPYYAMKDTEFSTGAFSVSEPCGTNQAQVSHIDVVVVPGIAFSKNGARVGFGKGCYDRLLAKSDAVKVGFCYELQICENIPADEYDIAMDYVVTEKEFINCTD